MSLEQTLCPRDCWLHLELIPRGNLVYALGVLLGCAESAQILRCPEQIDTEQLDRQDHYRILQEGNAMGDILKVH